MAGTIILGLFVLAGAAQDPAPAGQPDQDALKPVAAPLYGEDVIEPFVPLHPRTAEDRRQIEALRDYATARALEDRRQWREAIALLEQALKQDPDSLPILRRLGRLNFVLGRRDEAAKFGRRVLEVDPGDTATIGLMLEYHLRKNDPAGAEALLKSILDNPKLSRNSAGYLFAERSLGELYATRLRQPEKAADAFARVVEGLDEKAASRLSPGDQRRILGTDEADAYARFGIVFNEVQRHDLAIRAFQRGLAYDPDHAEIPRLLAETYLKAGRPEQALNALEPFLKRQPQGREPYELLTEILKTLKREEEILPRLEAAAKNDPKNAPLQYYLADRYREAGQREKADELYKQLLATQPDPQGFGALSASLLREKKFDELIKLLGDAFAKPDTLEAVKPQIEAIANDPESAELVLDAGLKLQQAEPPRLSKESRQILGYIATKAKKLDKLVPIQRLALRQDPSPQAYREFWLDLYRSGQYEEAAAILEEMLGKFPDERDARILAALAQTRALAGNMETALEAIDEALKLNPNDPDTVRDAYRMKGAYLARLGRNDEGIAFYKDLLDRFPNDEEILKLAHSGLSIIYVNMDQLDKGEAELEILLERYPDDPGVNNDLGYLYADQGKNLEKAEAMIRKAIAEEPENAAYLDSLGWVLFKQGKIQESLEPLEKAAKAGSADPTILDHLGDVYFKLMDLKKAQEAWRKAEQVAASSKPPDKRLADIRKKLESLKQLDPALTGPPGDSPAP
jgi:tetratricopeptide (TPR) repeat protein